MGESGGMMNGGGQLDHSRAMEWVKARERERRETERWSGTVWVRKCKINKQKKKRFYMFCNKLTLWHEIIWPRQHTHIWILDTSYQDCAANRLQSPPGNNSQEKCILCQKCISGAAHWCCERSLSLSHSSDSSHRCWMKRWVGATLYLTLQCRSSQNAAKNWMITTYHIEVSDYYCMLY